MTSVYAQERYSFELYDTSLSKVLKKVETNYNVSFSYPSDLIKNKDITLSAENLTLSEVLRILESHTSLTFERISKNRFILSQRNGNGKVCGYILDSETRLPISLAEIKLSEETKTITDDRGFFRIDKSKNNIYSIKKDGYISQDVLGDERCKQIYLTRSNQVLDEVIISEYVTSGIDKKKDGSIDVISKALGILPGLVTPDILQGIQLIPGINSLDESVSGIQIRGGTSDQNLILYDDIKLYNTGYFYGMFSTLNPFATQKANVFKSGTSAVYGDRISGIIDISTGEEILDEAEYGIGINGLSADAFVKTKLTNKLAVYLFGRSSYGDILRTLTYDGYAEKIFRNTGIIRDANGQIIEVPSDDEFSFDTSDYNFSFSDFSAKIIYEPNQNNKFIISGLFTSNDLDFSFEDDGETKIDDLSTKNNGFSLKWKHQNSSSSSEDITFYFSRYESEYRNDEFINETLDEINTRNNFISDFGLNIKLMRNFGNKNNLTFGYQFSNSTVEVKSSEDERIEIDEGIFTNRSNRNFKNALYIEYGYNFGENSVVDVGLRTVHYSSMRNVFFEPRFNIEYNLGGSFRIKGGLERRHQPISQIVEFDQGELRLENSLWKLSERGDTPLLKSYQLSTGLLFSLDNWIIDIDAYYKSIEGLTSFTNGFRTPLLEFDEGTSLIKGVDLLIKKRIRNYHVWAGYTFNDINYNFPSIQPEDFSGNNDITHSLRISNALTINNLELSLGWQFRTGEPFTPIASYDLNTRLVEFANINSGRLKDYHRLDASAILNFKINNWKSQFGLSVLNLYDREIPISYVYVTEDEGSGLELQQVIQRFSLGFTTNFSFRIFF